MELDEHTKRYGFPADKCACKGAYEHHWARVIACDLKTQPNEKRCHTMKETHRLELKPCCPISGNPLAGSVLEIEYRVDELVLEVAALRAYVDSYQGGRGDVRSMEGMCQQITQDCANAVQTSVHTRAVLNIAPEQQMIVECAAHISSVRWAAGAGRGAVKPCEHSGAGSESDPKLSDRRSWRGTCAVGLLVGAGAVTAEPVRCSAWLGPWFAFISVALMFLGYGLGWAVLGALGWFWLGELVHWIYKSLAASIMPTRNPKKKSATADVAAKAMSFQRTDQVQ